MLFRSGIVQEMMNGQRVIKVFCHEKQAYEVFEKANEELCEDGTKASDSESGGKEFILAGSNISTTKNTVTFFSGTHEVTARLAKSGTGMAELERKPEVPASTRDEALFHCDKLSGVPP